VVRNTEELVDWWDECTRTRTNVMSVHLTSTVRIGENRNRAGSDSFGRVWGVRNLRVNDASLLPDAPGVNPQGTIMAIAARNSDHFLATA
jgi:choline dehydrogenase-like flavoprotein